MNRKHIPKTFLAATVMMSIVLLFCGCTGGGNGAYTSEGSLPPDSVKPVPRLSQAEIDKLGALTSLEYNYGSFNGGAGATVPISGFGYSLAKGAKEGAKEGLLGALTGGLKGTAAGIAAAIIFGYLNALIFRSRTKR